MFDWMEILEISRPRHNLHVAEIFIEAFFCDMAGDMVLLREATVTREHGYDAGPASDRSPSSQSAFCFVLLFIIIILLFNLSLYFQIVVQHLV